MVTREWLLNAAVEEYGAEIGPILVALAKIESDYDETAVGDNGRSFGLWQIHRPAWPALRWPMPNAAIDQLRWIRPVVLHLSQSGLANPPLWWRWGTVNATPALIDRYREIEYENELRWARGNVPAEFGAAQVVVLLAMLAFLGYGTFRVRRTYQRFSTVRRTIAKLRR